MGIRFLAALAATSLLFTGTAVADEQQVDRRIIQQGLDEITTNGAQGAQLRVHVGRDRFTARSGTAEAGGNRPVPLNGRFRAGSITKTITATVVLQLAGEGRLDLDAPVVRYLPNLIDHRITVRHLLQMTSGLYNYTNSLGFTPEEFEPIRFEHWQPEELLAIATSKPLNFEPGAKWEYNNTNYVVLGLLIEKLTGKPYEVVVSQRVLKPLHLNATTLPRHAEIYGPHAHSYGIVNGQTIDTTRYDPSVFWSAGAIVSTTQDLDEFFTALVGGELLEPAQQAELTRTTSVSPDYGMGLAVTKLPCGTTILGHSGAVPGFLSHAFTTPDLKKRMEVSFTASTTQGDPTPAYYRVLNEVFC
jgi:D-alanyl-D-alanine carboxypeptidase